MIRLVHHAAGAGQALFKTVMMSGPVAVAMGAAGGGLFGLTLVSAPAEHTDAILTMAATLVVLFFVEWAIVRRLAAHEIVENKARQELGEELVKQGRENLAEAMLQIGGVGAAHDSILAKLKAIQADLREQGPKVDGLENALHRLEEAVRELERWRSRIGDRLGSLR